MYRPKDQRADMTKTVSLLAIMRAPKIGLKKSVEAGGMDSFASEQGAVARSLEYDNDT
jgi:hypothetical protein